VTSVRHRFTPLEDQRLRDLVSEHGQTDWGKISSLLGTRCARQCRERYRNYLDPTLRQEPWTGDEDQLLFEKFAEFGPKWALIQQFFDGRSEANVKNRWAQLMAKGNAGNSIAEEKKALVQELDGIIAGKKEEKVEITEVQEEEMTLCGGEMGLDWPITDMWNF
jgi:hypothetical protein